MGGISVCFMLVTLTAHLQKRDSFVQSLGTMFSNTLSLLQLCDINTTGAVSLRAHLNGRNHKIVSISFHFTVGHLMIYVLQIKDCVCVCIFKLKKEEFKVKLCAVFHNILYRQKYFMDVLWYEFDGLIGCFKSETILQQSVALNVSHGFCG